jgi:hypothetical protein
LRRRSPGAGAGGAAGGVIGALVGAGIPEHRAKVYDAGLRGGGILIGVEAKSARTATRSKNFSPTSARSTSGRNKIMMSDDE